MYEDIETGAVAEGGREGSEVRIFRDRVEKHLGTGDFGAAIEKYTALHAIGEASGCFTSPKILDVDARRRTVVMQRLHGWRQATIGAHDPTYWTRVGCALAAIHDGLSRLSSHRTSLCKDSRRELGYGITELLQGVPWKPAHGDFGLRNIGSWDGGALAVLDPLPNMYSCHGVWSIEPVLFDVALLASHLVGRDPRQWHRVNSTVSRRALVAFVEGYSQTSGIKVEAENLNAVMLAVVQNYLFGYRHQKVTIAAVRYSAFWLRLKLVLPHTFALVDAG